MQVREVSLNVWYRAQDPIRRRLRRARLPIALRPQRLLLVHSHLLARAASQFLRLLVDRSQRAASQFRHLLVRRMLRGALAALVVLVALVPAVRVRADLVVRALAVVLAVVLVAPVAVLVVVLVRVVARVGNVVRLGGRSVVVVVTRTSCNHNTFSSLTAPLQFRRERSSLSAECQLKSSLRS